MSANNAMFIWKKGGKFYCFDLSLNDEEKAVEEMPEEQFAVYAADTLEDAMLNGSAHSYLGYTEYGNYYMGEVC